VELSKKLSYAAQKGMTRSEIAESITAAKAKNQENKCGRHEIMWNRAQNNAHTPGEITDLQIIIERCQMVVDVFL